LSHALALNEEEIKNKKKAEGYFVQFGFHFAPQIYFRFC